MGVNDDIPDLYEPGDLGEATSVLFVGHGLPAAVPVSEAGRAQELFAERFDANVRRTDRLFACLMIGQWLFGILIALFISPHAWASKVHASGDNLHLAVLLGGAISAPPVALGFLRPGWRFTRMVIAFAQMLWSALLIHLSGGRIESHFHVFGSLAFLAFYRDWRVFVPATLVLAADRLIRQQLWPESVYGVLAPESWRFLEHAFWIAFEELFLIAACIGSVREMKLAAAQQTHIEFTNRLEREMEIASRIQTSMLPRVTRVKGLEISARMRPATEVGGDYYDILPVAGGCWLGIGDVAGHGLKAGLVMLQAQSAIEALVQRAPNAAPCEILACANKVLFENVRRRLESDEHVTMSLLRWYEDGRLITAGAHEETLIWRAETGRCERVPVQGTWLGAVPEIGRVTADRALRLRPGDLLVLYTDGVIEARNAERTMFGLDRLCAAVEKHAREPVERIHDRILSAVETWSAGRQEDDITLLVCRHIGLARAGVAE